MNFFVFDIETIPLPFDSFSESSQEYILRGTTTEEEIAKRKAEMALTPLTAQVVCIGLQIVERNEKTKEDKILKVGALAVDNALSDSEERREKLSNDVPCNMYNEKVCIEKFWNFISKYDPAHLISFNGRAFDAPFLMLRSALLEVRPSKNIMSGTKFNYPLHTDLIDELTFYSPSFNYGATKRFNFDFYTRAFGLPSPKGEGIDGSKVSEFYNQGKIIDIAEYCLRDVKATWSLYLLWEKYLHF
ncbi:3'-5' exonuclease [Bacteroidetes/Chlorobi group bacterium ChocPot_Mid]|jgi:DNA polymerase elongation subunit (family B)|nr:MAG: 3'-5' exonuclease [Bacteroidetes/Chlorobi group bacterium ChocPot_Mid]